MAQGWKKRYMKSHKPKAKKRRGKSIWGVLGIKRKKLFGLF